MRSTGKRVFSLLFGLLPLAVTTATACSTQAQAPVAAPARGGVCDSDGLERFVGRARSEQLGTEIRRQSGASTLRWVPYGTMITMEFNENRVTVHLDRSNRVERVVCG